MEIKTEFRWLHSVSVAACLMGAATGAHSEPVDTSTTPPPDSPLRWSGSIETFYQWNFNDPSNGLTNHRGFDNRHDSLTLSNAMAQVDWDDGTALGRLTLQAGHTPASYYQAEPAQPGASGAGGSDAALWRHVQQAWGGWRLGGPRGFKLTAGIVLSPIGPETMAVRDNWLWSRSTLFFALPYYHSAVLLTHAPADGVELTLGLTNGWNAIVDGNRGKSLWLQGLWTLPGWTLSALYFGGVERPSGAPEGQPWRHQLDAHLTWKLHPALETLLHANGGWERNTFGDHTWLAGALSARWRLRPDLWMVGRGDYLNERSATNGVGRASATFLPADVVGSLTAGLDWRPISALSLRLEYREDHASAPIYFAGQVAGDGVQTPFVPTASSQRTVTAGLVAGF